MKNTIGVIGCGFVGHAVAKGFAQYAEIKIFDIDNKKATHNFSETANCDFVFICLPTPMVSAEGGQANLSIIEDCFECIASMDDRNREAIYIIKSTTPIGTTMRLIEEYPALNIVHCPEFLTARTADIDFVCPSRNIVGCENIKNGIKVRDLMEDRFPGIPCFIVSSQESETIKYVANCFFATKIMFFNEIKLLVEEKDMDWDNILEGVLSDGRIALSHYEVPGHDGDKGWGRSCFPKDINSLISVMEDNGIDPLVMKAVWEQNKRIRNNWDWVNNSSAVSKNDE